MKRDYYMRYVWMILIILFLRGTLEACQSASLATPISRETPAEAPATDPTENTLQFQNTPESAEMPANPPPVEKFVSLSKKYLAGRLQIDAEGITLLKTAEMVWLNAALGCPRPGVFYPLGRVSGFQIWLEVEGVEYVYNTDLNGTVILCPELNPHVPNLDRGPTPGVPIK